MKRSFRKYMLLPPPTFRFWDRTFQVKICCETTDFVILAFTPQKKQQQKTARLAELKHISFMFPKIHCTDFGGNISQKIDWSS